MTRVGNISRIYIETSSGPFRGPLKGLPMHNSTWDGKLIFISNINEASTILTVSSLTYYMLTLTLKVTLYPMEYSPTTDSHDR